ncbi:hypothetical protein POM88_051334 [Heracleum sosnowskyi]|uniref:Uncharacterized protein n=1 Tax=Heracleum sosnowskyi TaxID=360622 RepID=A0AAD8H1Q0_9APIA|nr:hypothetical protein POM88_051334 [Heracleum sosnowskyi]
MINTSKHDGSSSHSSSSFASNLSSRLIPINLQYCSWCIHVFWPHPALMIFVWISHLNELPSPPSSQRMNPLRPIDINSCADLPAEVRKEVAIRTEDTCGTCVKHALVGEINSSFGRTVAKILATIRRRRCYLASVKGEEGKVQP